MKLIKPGKLSVLLPLMSLLAVGCDEGRIYDEGGIVVSEEGGRVRVTCEIKEDEVWPAQYTIAVAGFEEGNEYALISKNIESSTADGKCDVTLTGIPNNVSRIELCVIDRLRRRVSTFAEIEYIPSTDVTNIDFADVDLTMRSVVQRDIFNTTCIQCHGGSNYSAANLNLTAGESLRNLVNVQSVKMPELERLCPGKSDKSVLYRILSTDESSGWRYDHSVEIVRKEKLDLIKSWIDAM